MNAEARLNFKGLKIMYFLLFKWTVNRLKQTRQIGKAKLNQENRLAEGGEMNQMTLSSRHRILNSNPGDLRVSTLPLGDDGCSQYKWSSLNKVGVWASIVYLSWPNDWKFPGAFHKMAIVSA